MTKEPIMIDEKLKEEIKQVVTNLGNIKFTVEDELKFCKEVLKRKEQECERLKEKLNTHIDSMNKQNEKLFNENKQLKAENEKYKQLANSFENDFFNALSYKESNYVRQLKGEVHHKTEYIQEQRDIIDQLKAENKKLEEELELNTANAVVIDMAQRLYKYKQALQEIKEIAEVEIECKTYEIENDCFNETRCKALNEHIDFTKQILQKCEVIKE